MKTRHKFVSLFPRQFWSVILLLGGLALAGCTAATVPRGWSGGVITDNGTLYIGSMAGKLVALDVSDGRRLWAEPLKSPESTGGWFGRAPAATIVAIYGSPAVAGDLIYIGGYNGIIYALNTNTGALRWVYPRQQYLKPIVGGPVVALGNIYFASADGKVYALSAETGDDKVWKQPFETQGKIWSTPAIAGDTLFIGSFDKKLYALDATTGNQKWVFLTEGAIVATPLVDNNTVYIGSFDRYLYAVNASDGRLKWKFPAENWFWAKPVLYNGAIYAPSLDGKVYVLDVASGNKLAELDLGSPVSSSPVVAGNSVIIASEEGVVYALDTRTNQAKWQNDELKGKKQKIYASLSIGEGKVYVHTTGEELRILNAQSGAKLWSISLSSN